MNRALSVLAVLPFLACAQQQPTTSSAAPRVGGGEQQVTREQVLRGRLLTINHVCGGCHGGGDDPSNSKWLSGARDTLDQFKIGPFTTRPRNLTPDSVTGLGRYSMRQIFNALRFGLRPGKTPDVEITSTIPGQGNFPAEPKYLAPPMPWPEWRHMTDQELWDIAAYLKHGLRPVSNQVADSEGPPDFWADAYTVEKIGSYPAPAFPTAAEALVIPAGAPQVTAEQVRRGRFLTINHACGGCHGGGGNPASPKWLSGVRDSTDEFKIGPFTTRPRNLTPDNSTGLGRFSMRQIFNALRFGLRPGETPDVEITSSVPGQGNFPMNPKFLAPPMPWMAWRHMSDQELWDIAAYLKHGVKPVSNRVKDSEGPPDFWASEMVVPKIGTYPAPAFPTANEEFRP